MKRFSVAHVFLSGIIVLIGVLVFTANVRSQPAEPAAVSAPSATLFSYQGQILDSGGNPVNNAAMPMTFKLFTTATGGTACWTEDHTGGTAVNVQNGQFKALLGQTTAIPDSCLTGDAYLELTINGETLSPREILTSVAYAVEASTIKADAITRGKLTVADRLSVEDSLYIRADGGSYLRLINSTTGELWQTSMNTNDELVTSFYDGTSVWTQMLKLFSTGTVKVASGNLAVQGNVLQINDGGTTTSQIGMAANDFITFDDSTAPGTYTFSADGGNGNATLTAGGVQLSGDVDLNNNDLLDVSRIRASSGTSMNIMGGQSENLFIKSGGTTGKVQIGGGGGAGVDLEVYGNVTITGTCNGNPTSSLYESGQMVLTDYHLNEDCRSGSIVSGAYVESNLMSSQERQQNQVTRFSEGDLLCWGEEQLELCESEGSALVQAVADKNGRPIVLGAERIKVLGSVHKGDYLIASGTPGYAIATQNPTFGIVIAQALEDFDGSQGLILAMIRKM
ncbi:MAG: hypothetical protein KDE56_26200 [Anaerolineales bacterium]|nr:hypothetical protein [Anaerolineales bacterium]